MRIAVAAIAGVTWLVAGVATMVYAERIRVHRNDIGPHDSVYSGHSRWLEGNILDPANYDATGQSKVRILRVLCFGQTVPAGIFLYSVFAAV